MLLLGLACDTGDECPTAPPASGAHIIGTVTASGTTYPPRLELQGVGENEGFTLRREFDASGHLSVHVPLGAYQAWLRVGYSSYTISRDRIAFGFPNPDTVLLEEATPTWTFDYTFGGLDVTVDTPSELDGELVFLETTWMGGDPSNPLVSDPVDWRARVWGNARFAPRGLLPGSYRLALRTSSGDNHEAFFLPPARDTSAAAPVWVVEDQVVPVQYALTDSPAVIGGQITGAWRDLGRPSAPCLEAYTPEGDFVCRLMTPNAFGTFRATLFDPVTVCLKLADHPITRWVGGLTIDTATRFALEPGSLAVNGWTWS